MNLASRLLIGLLSAFGGTASAPKPMVDPMFGFRPVERKINTSREQARRLRQRNNGTHGL